LKVKMRTYISGTRNGEPWPVPGTVVDLPDEEAMALCSQGSAEPVAKRDAEKVEKAVAPEAEERGEEGPLTTRRGPGRPRKAEE
jgi:hypothetical protein